MDGERRYSGLPDSSRWSLIDALEEQGERFPDDAWVKTTDCASLTFGAALDESSRVAGFLASIGVAPAALR